MLTRKAAGEKQERALTFTFKLAACLNPARFALPPAKAANFAAMASHAIQRTSIMGGHVPILRRVLPVAVWRL
jgi:hypothetical protein